MLWIQKIDLTWNKQERGVKGENARRRFLLAYPLEEIVCQEEVLVQQLHFFQQGEAFLDAKQEARQSLERYLPKLGFTKAQIQKEIQNRIRWITNNQYQTYASLEALNLTNLAVQNREDTCQVTFFYDEQRSGAPMRRGHNQDFQNPDSPFYGRDALNETAFVLTPNQYGRILWNERRTDYDTGEWYYQLHVYNLFFQQGKHVSKTLFVKKKPDYVYRQMARLY